MIKGKRIVVVMHRIGLLHIARFSKPSRRLEAERDSHYASRTETTRSA